MQLQSHPKAGATSPVFSFSKPAAAQSAKASKTILLIDDDDILPLLLTRALKRLNPPPVLNHAPNALQAKDYLSGQFQFADRTTYPFPDLVLLDLMLPGFTGFDFLEWTHSHTHFKDLPIVALTGSLNPRHLTRAYQLGATSFLVKPTYMEEIVEPLNELLQR